MHDPISFNELLEGRPPSPNAVADCRRRVREAVLACRPGLVPTDPASIQPGDLHRIQLAIDLFHCLGNLVWGCLDGLRIELGFQLESRPFAGGRRNRVFDPSVEGPQHHQIIVSRPWLEEACRKGNGRPRVAGLECEDALDGLQRLMEEAVSEVGAHFLDEDPARIPTRARQIAWTLFRHP